MREKTFESGAGQAFRQGLQFLLATRQATEIQRSHFAPTDRFVVARKRKAAQAFPGLGPGPARPAHCDAFASLLPRFPGVSP